MRPDDVIVSWDGQSVGDATELTLVVGKTKVGSRVKVIVMRDGQKVELGIAVDERPPSGDR
jgi:S1-C subfamily serine protease